MLEKERKQNDFTLSDDAYRDPDICESARPEKSETGGLYINETKNYYSNCNINSNNNNNNNSNNNSNSNNNNNNNNNNNGSNNNHSNNSVNSSGNNSSNDRSKENRKAGNDGGFWDKKDFAQIILAILALITAAITGFFGYKTAAASSDKLQISAEDSVTEEMTEPEFYCSAEKEEAAGISYIKYEITAVPKVEGYHVKPYPYLLYEKRKEDIVFPLKNIFTQEEYPADTEGKCVLRQEKSMESVGGCISEILEDKPKESYRIETILVISYGSGKDNKDLRECYFLEDGKLSKPDFKICNQVLEKYQDEEAAYIDMSNWPKNEEEIRKLINSE